MYSVKYSLIATKTPPIQTQILRSANVNTVFLLFREILVLFTGDLALCLCTLQLNTPNEWSLFALTLNVFPSYWKNWR